MILGGDLVEGAQVDDDAVGAIVLAHEHGARAERAPTGSDQLCLHLLVDDLGESPSLLSALRTDANARRGGGAIAMGRLERWSGDGVTDGVGIPRGAAKAAAMALEEVADSSHLGRVGVNLGAEVNHAHQFVAGVLRFGTNGGVPMLELGEGAELGYPDRVVVGVEDSEGHGAVVSHAGDGRADENVEPTRDTVSDALEEDERTRRHGGWDLDADDLLEAALRDDDVLWREGERADGSGEWLGLEDLGRKGRGEGGEGRGRGVALERRGDRSADGSEGGAESAGRMVVADLGGTEVNGGRSGSMEVVAEDKGVKPLHDSNVADEVLAVLEVHLEIDVATDEAGAPDAAKGSVSDTVGDLAAIDVPDGLGEVGPEGGTQGFTNESHGATGVGAVSDDGGGPPARANGALGEPGGAEEGVEAVDNSGGGDGGNGEVAGGGDGAGKEAGRRGRAIRAGESLLDRVNPVEVAAGG